MSLYNWYFREGIKTDPSHFSFWQIHHFYWGLIPLVVGFYGIFNWSLWVDIPLLVLAAWLIIDDILQHIIQKFEIDWNGGYYVTRSFWNWFPGKLGLYRLAKKLGIKP